MFKKSIQIILPILLVVFILGVLLAGEARADLYEDIIKTDQLDKIKENIPGLPGEDEADGPLAIVATVIKAVLGTLVMVFLVLIIYAGFRWMTAGGNEETVMKAKKIIGSALIGLVIILFSYVITAFVFKLILEGN